MSDILGSLINLDLMARYGPRFLDGVLVTLQLVGISFILGGLLAVPVALARLSKNSVPRALAYSYVYFFRGTPLLAQVFLVYYGAGQLRDAFEAVGLWTLFRDAWFCALLTFTLNTAAYQAEILRGGIRAVPGGQREAAFALGLPRWLTFGKVVLPQALVTALRPLGNELILMIKASAIVSLITIYDVMGVTRLAFSRSFDFQVYLWAAALYLILVEGVRRLWAVAERRLTRHLKPA
ncbi:ABC transporter permease [Chelatococcus daeguensis]|uniref:ABC transporter permease n=2 Tax=Chelatococcus TaxID=28209 RepID=A0AAC9JP40_9HYPH|nr:MULTISPECIES: ABC transporter permease [Chelatococcus]APF37093.1 ABC transporter permease [Chelatococcus daeguensis]KZE35607.1 ABC transporter permease [Chelatococcus daeguensis]MBM3084884.1 ABC transporter permease [Chelatococcus daeguensis]CUA87860.1 amine acid ABC transporter, permease protein, 3-TM region, His/Glu/Gln/Arg/opine family [Chelatococcus sambhunathii]